MSNPVAWRCTISNRAKVSLLSCVVVFCFLYSQAQSPQTPALSTTPLTQEQISIYREFLSGYNNGSKAILNVSKTTGTFEAVEGDLAGCMKSFSKSNSRITTVHVFPSDTFPADHVRLVDPQKHKLRDPGTSIHQGQSVDDAVDAGFASGLFTFSEIVFDNSHNHAALNYSFHCGSLCGHGGTVVFTKEHDKWKQTKQSCGQWIS